MSGSAAVRKLSTETVGSRPEREPAALPVDQGALLGVEVGHLHLEAAGGALARQGAGEGALPYPALLRHEAHDHGHSAVRSRIVSGLQRWYSG